MQGASLIVPAPAKLNLFLHVTGRRADGYHTLESLLVLLDFGDTLTLWCREDGGIVLARPLPGQPRTPTVAFTLRHHAAIDVARHLAERAVFVSHGDFYAATIIRLLGQAEQGVVRAGCACYTSPDEIERLIIGVAELASR